MAPLDDRTTHVYDELRALDALRCQRPGWLWLGYVAFGVAFWTGMGLGSSALIAAL